VIDAAVTPVTKWKLRQTVRSASACLAALSDLDVVSLPPLQDGPTCGIDPRVRIAGAFFAELESVDTTCAVALRMAMWDRHVVQPAAERHLNQRVNGIDHLSSYSCRAIRTSDVSDNRQSTHATAQAIDISGFRLSDGQRITLLADWTGETESSRAFLRVVRNGACDWFATVLGPDYNILHADHFHLQSRGWGTCR
jgi:hypothetical protein